LTVSSVSTAKLGRELRAADEVPCCGRSRDPPPSGHHQDIGTRERFSVVGARRLYLHAGALSARRVL
jgi:hypothetical protein